MHLVNLQSDKIIMGKRFIVATIHDMSQVPKDCVYLGDGKFDFVIDDKDDPYNITKKLAEYDQKKAQYHKDKTFKKSSRADTEVSKDEKTKPVTKTDKPLKNEKNNIQAIK